MMMLRKKDKAALSRAGTSSVTMMGSRKTSTLTRISTSSHISIWATVKSCRAGMPSRAVVMGIAVVIACVGVRG